jgi:uncharacterized zinc-type alcohol dehydrogenase-like protein
MTSIQAWAAASAAAPLNLVSLELPPLNANDVEIAVEHCGLCSADDSLWRNASGATRYPFVPGHEIIGRICATGSCVPEQRIGERVGVGWINGSCMRCWPCLGGSPHLCKDRRRTVIGQPGGFSSRARCHAAWAVPLPDRMNAATAGPFFCAGLAVFRPLVELGVLPTWRVGVVGLGGLGHLALKFLVAWGCEVVAFTSHERKAEDALQMGASIAVSARDDAASRALRGTLDLLLATSKVADWPRLFDLLAPRGRVHVLAATAEPITVPSSVLIGADRSIAGSMVGSPATAKEMLDFAARHAIAPEVERLPMSRANEAMQRFASGDVRYRVVLDADFDTVR